MVLFAQESGRAGRDGKQAYSLVLLPSSWEAPEGIISTPRLPATHDISLGKQRERQAMHRYLEGEQCFRTSLSEYLDSAEQRRWCMPEDVPCDICQQSHEEAIGPLERDQSYRNATESTGSTIIQDTRRRAYSELARFREDLVVVRGSCLLCRAMGEGWEHDFKSCYRRADVFRERKQARIRYESKGRKWLQPYSACF
jgi:superfamily II DNA helicase RecQ